MTSANLIVEDGTGLATADSLVSLSDALAFWTAQGLEVPDDQEKQKQALRRASLYLSEAFPWKGWRRRGRDEVNTAGALDGGQALAWPREGVLDREGYTVDWTSVPREVKYATARAAAFEANNPDVINPAYIENERVRMEKAGPVQISYDTTGFSVHGSRPMLLGVLDLIGQFLNQAAGNRKAGLAVRV